MLLAEIGLGELILSMLWLFFLFMWFWLFISLLSDVIRDRATSGASKALWILLLVVLPILGSLLYLALRGGSMAERAIKNQAEAQDAFNDYVRQAAGTAQSPADQLAKLAELKSSGAIDDAEYSKLKAKIVG
jgi:hypothetical protein